MKAYLAGKLGTAHEKELLMKVDSLCKAMGLQTFLPHRDVGRAEQMSDVAGIFEGDITKGLQNSDIIIAVLDGLHVGAGTAWELGYAYARGTPAVGVKTDEPIAESLEYLSPILIGSMPIVTSFEELEQELRMLIKRLR